MKKLMFLAVVASATVASAVTCVKTTTTVKDPCTGKKDKVTVTGAATANKIAITLKTTAVKSKTTKKATNCSAAECKWWREQKSMKINGLLWAYVGEDCDSCASLDFASQNVLFWTNDKILPVEEFGIGVGIIGGKAKSTSVEAYGGMTGTDFGNLAWAGFGSLATSKAKTSSCGDVTDCDVWVKTITGGIAGTLVPAEFDGGICGDLCDPIEYDCELCCSDKYEQLSNTAAYGTIKITYDAATAKKIVAAATLGQNTDDITTFTKLPAAALVEDGEIIDPSDYVGTVTIEE